MSDFNTVIPGKKPLDPLKRVKYTMGLVLGVEEFEQEQLYLMERDRLHHRALHGYGTVSGLKVSIPKDTTSPSIMVTPGLAVNPKGESICVPENQCASLNDWLQQNQEEVTARLGSPPLTEADLSLYVVLCYKECETDNVPIPGGPCRSREDTMAASRIADYFDLSLRLEPPAQIEEEKVRAFGDLLKKIEITIEPKPYLTVEQMEKLVRSLPKQTKLPSGTFPPGKKYYLHPGKAEEVLQAGFHVWVTEVRPKLLGDESCVLLAQLDFPIHQPGEIWQVKGDSTDISIIEDNRPFLLHTRLLQEWLLSEAKTAHAGVTIHKNLQGLDKDDHKQYLLADGTRALTGDWSAGDHKITNLVKATANGDAVPFQQAIKSGDKAGGDLGGKYPDPTVNCIQKKPVSKANPQKGDVLTWDGSQWTPIAGKQETEKLLPFVTITQFKEENFDYELWFNIDAPGNKFEIAELPNEESHISVYQEIEPPPLGPSRRVEFLEVIKIREIKRQRRNVFILSLSEYEREKSYLLRFRFNLAKITMKSGESLKKYASEARIRFLGYDNKDTVTVFVRVQREG